MALLCEASRCDFGSLTLAIIKTLPGKSHWAELLSPLQAWFTACTLQALGCAIGVDHRGLRSPSLSRSLPYLLASPALLSSPIVCSVVQRSFTAVTSLGGDEWGNLKTHFVLGLGTSNFSTRTPSPDLRVHKTAAASVPGSLTSAPTHLSTGELEHGRRRRLGFRRSFCHDRGDSGRPLRRGLLAPVALGWAPASCSLPPRLSLLHYTRSNTARLFVHQ